MHELSFVKKILEKIGRMKIPESHGVEEFMESFSHDYKYEDKIELHFSMVGIKPSCPMLIRKTR